jgi:light-regulated signal transduction histidine kinase (bacteriophytochrome)
VADRRRRRISYAAIHLTAALALLVVAATSVAAYRHSRYLTAALVPSMLLLMTSHALLARAIRRHELIERALHDTNRELESFSYSVSHDLRSPLRSIDGFSQALVEDAGPALDEESRGHLERILNATRRMGRLIDDLLALSKVTRAEMKSERVDLSDIATQIAAELARQSPKRNVAVTIAPGLTSTGDPQLVRLALQNLIENAWKFTSRREAAAIEVGSTKDEDGTQAFYVRDNGAGYDPNFATNLFGPFQRLHPASEFPGSGIGLATVQRIVHRHGGHVWAEGKTDEGACFYFTLS